MQGNQGRFGAEEEDMAETWNSGAGGVVRKVDMEHDGITCGSEGEGWNVWKGHGATCGADSLVRMSKGGEMLEKTGLGAS